MNTNTWTGGSPISGYWAVNANWQFNDLPDRSGLGSLVFPDGAAGLQNTNNFTPVGPALVDRFYQVLIGRGGYELYGNPLQVNIISASYVSGTNSTIYFDLVDYARVEAIVANTRLTLAGDLIFTIAPLLVCGNGDCVISGIISGNQGTHKAAGSLGALIFSGLGANTYTGTTYIDDGTLRLNRYRILPGPSTGSAVAVPGDLVIGEGSSADAFVVLERSHQIADTSAVTINSKGQLDLNNNSDTIGGLVGDGAVNLGSGALTVSNATDHAFSGNMRGGRDGFAGADVTKDGPGTWTLSGSNTYWGKTYVNGGTLLVNGTFANSDTVISRDGTLGGSGTVQGISVSGAGGTVAPGASAGRLTAQGVVALTNATFEVELNGRTPGTEYDQLVTDQAPILSGLLRQSCDLSVLVGFTPPVGSTFVIISNRSAKAVSGTFNGKAQNANFAADGFLFQISYTGGSGNDVVLTRVAAPAVSNFVASATGGQMQLQAQGIASVSYVLEATPHLNTPIPWQPIKTNLANGSGLIQFTDADMPAHAQRFYRIASP